MKLDNKTVQPYRIWYEYLKTALDNKEFSKKINKKYYENWNLSLVKKLKFNNWIKTHEHLFNQSNNSEIKLYEGKRSPNTLLVEIPISFNVQRIQKEIGKAVKGKVAQSQANLKFKIQTNRPLQTAPLDYFRWAYEFKQKGNFTHEEVWEKVSDKIDKRQAKIAKRIEQYKKTGKGIRSRHLSGAQSVKDDKQKSILISRNIKKAKNILNNVCKGIFPGDYSDH